MSVRCRMSHRPPFQVAEPSFYRCDTCGGLMVQHNRAERSAGTGAISCGLCGIPMRMLDPLPGNETAKSHSLSYTVFGGFEHNAIEVGIACDQDEPVEGHQLEWVYLHSFQGGQMKFLSDGVRPLMRFAFADDDAYSYCDRPVCRMGHEFCQFSCKRGFAVYAYCSTCGLMRWPLVGRRKTDIN